METLDGLKRWRQVWMHDVDKTTRDSPEGNLSPIYES